MKKIISLALALCMLLMVGCSAASSTPATPSGEAPASSEAASSGEKMMWRIGTASMTGNFYTLGSAFALMINEKMEGSESAAQATGGSADNCFLLDDKEIEIGLIQSATVQEAVTGTGAFAETGAIDSMRGVGVIYLTTFHCIVNNKSGVEKISDLQGKKIGVGPMGGGVEVNANILLSEFGVTDFTPIYGTMGEALEGVKNGEVDAVIYATSTGTANVSDALNSGNCTLIGMTEEEAAAICERRPEFGLATIPANSYQEQPEDIHTFAGTALIVTRADIDDDAIYNLCKTFYENNEFLVSQNAIFAESVLENAATGMCVPFHPGAEKYLKEQGAL